jgi:hypothetical protein
MFWDKGNFVLQLTKEKEREREKKKKNGVETTLQRRVEPHLPVLNKNNT